MLRFLLLLLVLLNGAYYVWSSGVLLGMGFGPSIPNEPQRVVEQIKPSALQLLTDAELKGVEAQVQADLAPKECLRAGPLDAAQVAALQPLLEKALPADAWQLDTTTEPAQWMVYMGKFSSVAAMEKKQTELTELQITGESVQTDKFQPGLSLGNYASESAAQAALARFAAKGVRTARVLQERAEQRLTMLKLPALPQTLKPQLETLTPALGDKGFKKCS